MHKWHDEDKKEPAYVLGKGRRTFTEMRGLEDDLKPRERLFRPALDTDKMKERMDAYTEIRKTNKKMRKGKEGEPEEEEEERGRFQTT
ncbi:hypothetical protein EKO27_g10312 [Xylaria grammica]|uniref:Uncharacterized protein n=1 Tax=Xylaria grammica TaxID=363999 RepID=A0A439CRJ2_9PEZI|nr:hypothetical protein EKO27_g10312 [Xylaria grammica]